MFPYGEDMMKKMYENWEKSMGEHLENMVKSQSFVSEMAKAIAASMGGQASTKKIMDETLISMNLPTRGELVKALQKLTDIEERLMDIQEKIEDLSAGGDCDCAVELKKISKAVESFKAGMGAVEVKAAKITSPAAEEKAAPRKADPRKADPRKPKAKAAKA